MTPQDTVGNNTMIARPKPIETVAFAPDAVAATARYGLPVEVAFCKRCVISNQRPNSSVEFLVTEDSPKTTIRLDDYGICDACHQAEIKQREIDWAAREAELTDLCGRYRRHDGQYDCLVPGSGGKDSFYAAHRLKVDFGMHPLTVTWAPHLTTEWGRRNFERWLAAGFDNMLFTPNPLVHRLVTRLALDKLFHPFQPFALGQKNMAPRMAAKLGIPLVFYGENEAEYGNPLADNKQAERDGSYFAAEAGKGIHLGGVSFASLIEDFELEAKDLDAYLPADAAALRAAKVEVHYLGHYLKWHPQSCYYYAVEHGNFEASPERTPGTYSKYNSIDDKMDDFHYYSTYIKFGIGRATYDAAQEVRSGDIEREDGVALVRKFDGEFPERFVDELFDFLSITPDLFPVASSRFEQPVMDRDYFMALTDSYRSPHLWRFENGTWTLRRTVWSQSG